MTTEAPRIAVVMPRNMRFGPRRAGSIDLCVYDFVRTSRFRDSTTIIAEHVDEPYAGLDVRLYPKGDSRRQVALIRDVAPDLIVVQQHVPSAVRIARRMRGTPLLVHRHNDLKAGSGVLSRWRHRWRFGHLDALVFVSDFCSDKFRQDWPGTRPSVHTVHNALEMSSWHPRLPEGREKVIAYTGRIHPLKGVRELACALAEVLPGRPDWRAHLMLTRGDVFPALRDEIARIVAPLGAQVQLTYDAPFDRVVAALSSAAIAAVPTLNAEPFGRAALEAMAGGAALASAISGGLGEVVGDTAVHLSPVSVETIAAALARLADDPALRQALAERGRERAEQKFELTDRSGDLDAVYTQVMMRQQRAA